MYVLYRDYTRPVKDTVLYGLPSPPQHMADAVKVLIALQVRNTRFAHLFLFIMFVPSVSW
eukprot:COSAG06_NODE_1700_length_8675_cov_3.485774_5_plen_60_part_00